MREGDQGGDGFRERFEVMIRAKQDEICAAVEELDGGIFHEDSWTRPGGGGGISRVLQGGNVFEKAGVNVSVVYGSMPPDAYRAATGGSGSKVTEAVPFFAAGISSVMHPWNPMAPTMHFNYRYFETQPPEGMDERDAPRAWWFGGGTDITPSYLFEEDLAHFHGTYKDVCDKHDPEYYAKFKKWADDYFVIKHRGETRGLGGIFFDDQNVKSKEEHFAFSTDCAAAVVPSYVPLVAKHKDDAYSAAEKEWQQLRRGRYVEFNLLYDRGVRFGLQGGRMESIMVSAPPAVAWGYNESVPEQGTEEYETWKFLTMDEPAVDWADRKMAE